MTHIAAPAIHLAAEKDTEKKPVKGGAASAKSNFLLHLAGAKTTATPAIQPELDTAAATAGIPRGIAEIAAAESDFTTPATGDAGSSPQLAPPKTSGPTTNKTIRPSKKETATQPQTCKETLPSILPAAATVAPAAPQPTATAPSGTQTAPVPAITPATSPTHIVAAPTLKQTVQAAAFTKTSANPAMPGNPPSPVTQTAIAATPAAPVNSLTADNSAASHKSASSHTAAQASRVTSQLADALPQNTTKPGTDLALHIALKPETLGAITIKIQHSGTGDTNVILTASQPETLETLKKDVGNINQMLTNAGVPEAGRQIDFRATPVAEAQSGTALGNSANSAMQNSAGGQQSHNNGTGFANSSLTISPARSAPAPSPMPATPRNSIAGGLDMIA